MTASDRSIQRHYAIRAVLAAIKRVPGLVRLGTIHDHIDIFSSVPGLSVDFTVGDDPIRIIEDESGVLRVFRSGLIMLTVENADPRALSYHLVRLILNRPSIPAESRRKVRDVIAAAHRNAEYHFREGMAHILTHRDHEANWGTLDEPDRWEAIREAFVAARGGYGPVAEFLPTYQQYGVPMDIIDIYQDAYHERALDLLASIMPRKDRTH